MGDKPVFRVGAAGLDPRDWRLIEIVFRHSQYNRYEFRLAPQVDADSIDVLIANPGDVEGLQAMTRIRQSPRMIPVIAAVPRGTASSARHAISIDRLTLQLLPILNRVVELELLAAGSGRSGAAAPGTAATPSSSPAPRPLEPARAAPARASEAPFPAMLRRADDPAETARPSWPGAAGSAVPVPGTAPAASGLQGATDPIAIPPAATASPFAAPVTAAVPPAAASEASARAFSSAQAPGSASAAPMPGGGSAAPATPMPGGACAASAAPMPGIGQTARTAPAAASTSPAAAGTSIAAAVPMVAEAPLPESARVMAAAATPAATPAAAVAESGTTVPADGPRVLVVDDSPTVRRQLAVAFERLGLRCEQAASAAEALRRLEDTHFDLVLADVVMPDMDGYRLTREIKRNRRLRGLPVIILTSRASPFDLARGALAGCDSYLTKPVPFRALEAAVRKQLRRSLAIDDLSGQARAGGGQPRPAHRPMLPLARVARLFGR